VSLQAKKIRAQVVAGLKAERTSAGENVFANRTRPVWQGKLPAILVFTRDESVEPFQAAPKTYKRTLSLAVVVVDASSGLLSDPVDDRLDDMAQAVEQWFFRDPLLGLGEDPTVKIVESDLKSVELVNFQSEDRPAELDVAGQRITFSVRYLEDAIEGRSEDVEPLRGIAIDYRLPPDDGQSDAQDVVELEGS
jgi:hypothetical protein